MAALFADNFNRANGGFGANWTNLATAWSIVSNQGAAPSTDASAYVNSVNGPANGYVKVTAVNVIAPTAFIGLIYRLDTATFNGYYLGYDTTGASLYRLDGGVPTQVGASFGSFSAGTVVEIRYNGSTHEIFYDGVSQGTRTDGAHTAAGRCGLSGRGTACRVDNFEFGTPVTDTPLAVDVGNLTLAGQSVTLAATAHVTLPVTVANLALAGQAITLTATDNHRLAVDVGNLDLQGQDISLAATANARLSVDPGDLALEGQDVTLAATESLSLDVEPADLALTGQSVGLIAGEVLGVTPADLSLAGQAVAFAQTLAVVPADLTLAGQAISLLATAHVSLSVEVGNLSLAGQDITLEATAHARLSVDVGNLTLTGQDVTLLATANVVMTVEAADLALTGGNVGMQAGDEVVLSVEPSDITLQGQAVTFGQTFGVTPADLVFAGQAVDLLLAAVVVPANLQLTGQEIGLLGGEPVADVGAGAGKPSRKATPSDWLKLNERLNHNYVERTERLRPITPSRAQRTKARILTQATQIDTVDESAAEKLRYLWRKWYETELRVEPVAVTESYSRFATDLASLMADRQMDTELEEMLILMAVAAFV